ncbi:competence protein CoiA [Paenibacillus oleatilyticus]|uniref:competence protein CoiA n=1 Tax=Paenibacillus oleatilyticus TaxID=2594886 RepID=UPI001C200E67|nr:competence protein CoiA [Paenibacillus oleatilyticus]MBU7318217.1 competence protein CoiA [Paenibacillus oleatilyticus]
MTNYAIDKVLGKKFNIEEWSKNCQNRSIGECPICDEDVFIKADKSPNRSTHFSHYPNSKCPTIKGNRRPFVDLAPSEIDEENAIQIKSYVIENLYAIYLKCNSLADGIKFNVFRDLIITFNQKNIWNYKGLTLKYIPYILLTCRDKFPKNESGFRKDDFYFVFEPNMRYGDDLWNKPHKVKQKIWKVLLSNGNFEEYEILDEWIIEPEWFKTTRDRIQDTIK